MGAETKPRLYVVPLSMSQSICWNPDVCGHGLMGGVNLGGPLGEGIPCNRPAAECPRFKDEMSTPYGTFEHPNGEEFEFYLRALHVEASR
jgi:hypothetical protein